MSRELRVFVLYSRNLDAVSWEEKYEKGLVPDRTPYGYHHAENYGCKVTYSDPTSSRGALSIFDKLLRFALKFDLVHVFNNRRKVFDRQFDVIWTHTEREFLAIGLLMAMSGRKTAPVLAQSVWLIDRWPSYGALRKAFFKRLISKMGMLTFLSTRNTAAANDLNLGVEARFVPFGISMDSFPLQPPRARVEAGRPLRVLAIGNDMHRDWRTLSEALGGVPQVALRILSGKFPDQLLHKNISVETTDQRGVVEAYEWADCVVVPVIDNLHASGVTVALEAAALGVPLVIARGGGLDHYLDDEAAFFFDVGDVESLRSTVLGMPSSDYLGKARMAQKQLQDRDLTTAGYSKRSAELSRELLDA
jgi:glycosyltransferase involved in cell wall biosynthesis